MRKVNTFLEATPIFFKYFSIDDFLLIPIERLIVCTEIQKILELNYIARVKILLSEANIKLLKLFCSIQWVW